MAQQMSVGPLPGASCLIVVLTLRLTYPRSRICRASGAQISGVTPEGLHVGSTSGANLSQDETVHRALHPVTCIRMGGQGGAVHLNAEVSMQRLFVIVQP